MADHAHSLWNVIFGCKICRSQKSDPAYLKAGYMNPKYTEDRERWF